MRCPLEFADETQASPLVFGKRPHYENRIRAGGHAIGFAFTFVTVYDGDENARVLFTGSSIGHVRLSLMFHFATNLVPELYENVE